MKNWIMKWIDRLGDAMDDESCPECGAKWGLVHFCPECEALANHNAETAETRRKVEELATAVADELERRRKAFQPGQN